MSHSAVAPDIRPSEPDTTSAKGFAWWMCSGFLTGIGLISLGAAGRWIYESDKPVVSHHAVVKGTLTQVGARLSGQLVQVLVEENQRVSKGDLLARLDDQSAQAGLARARVELERLQKQYALEQAAVESERTRHSKRTAPAQNTSGNPGTVAADTYQGDSPAARLATETLKLRASGLQSLQRQIATAEDSVAAANAELELTLIHAPEDGWVNRRIVEAGESVRAGDPFLSMWVGQRVWIEVWVGQSHLAELQVGSKVEVRFIAYTGQTLTGMVQHVEALPEGTPTDARLAVNCDPIFGEASHYRVRISIPADDLRIVPGLTALVSSPAPATVDAAAEVAEIPAAERDHDRVRQRGNDVAKR